MPGKVHANSQTIAWGLSFIALWERIGLGSISTHCQSSFSSRCNDCEAIDIGSFAPTSTQTPFLTWFKNFLIWSFSFSSSSWIFFENVYQFTTQTILYYKTMKSKFRKTKPIALRKTLKSILGSGTQIFENWK